ncbi:TPA: hypothetical protein ACPVZG_003538 [Vibrio parahaemolyticus]
MGLVKRIRKPEDVGQVLTDDYLRKLRAINSGIWVITGIFSVCALVGLYWLCYVEDIDSSSLSIEDFGFYFVKLAAVWFMVLCVFMFLFYEDRYGFTYRDMPQSMCEEVLESLDKYSELEFLKERIANMDRKLTTEEGLYITNYHRVILKKKSEDSCKRLYGINSGAE